jgi:hypothetical protein
MIGRQRRAVERDDDAEVRPLPIERWSRDDSEAVVLVFAVLESPQGDAVEHEIEESGMTEQWAADHDPIASGNSGSETSAEGTSRVEKSEVVDIDPDSADEELEFIYSITSYGADYPVDGLVKRIESGDIAVPAFQRQFIWPRPRIERFIESLLLGLPVPGIFLALEPESNRLLVIDGQQRLRTLAAFYKGVLRGQEFKLSKGVQSQFVGRTYETLEAEERRRLDDSIIHATVIRQDEPSNDQSSVYFIFERLNTGGTLLQPQEIRAAIFQGPFNALLHELNEIDAWRSVFGAPSLRMKDQELILRFFAFFFAASQYKRPMKEFLNDFMGGHRKLEDLRPPELRERFDETVSALSAPGAVEPRRLFRPGTQINAAVFDAVMVGMARRLESGPIRAPGAILAAYEGLLGLDDFKAAYSRATADEASVEARLRLATEAFSVVR